VKLAVESEVCGEWSGLRREMRWAIRRKMWSAWRTCINGALRSWPLMLSDMSCLQLTPWAHDHCWSSDWWL